MNCRCREECCSWTFMSFLVQLLLLLLLLLVPLFELVFEIFIAPKLYPATCEIKEPLSNNYFEVLVIPKDESVPLSKIVSLDDRKPDDRLGKGDKIPCFYSGDIIRLHSDRLNVNIGFVLVNGGIFAIIAGCYITVCYGSWEGSSRDYQSAQVTEDPSGTSERGSTRRNASFDTAATSVGNV